MAHTKKAAPAYFVKAVCCGAVTVFHHCCTKKLFFSAPGDEAEEKSFLFCCSVFSCPAKSSFTVSEEPEKMFDFGSRGEFLFHFFNSVI